MRETEVVRKAGLRGKGKKMLKKIPKWAGRTEPVFGEKKKTLDSWYHEGEEETAVLDYMRWILPLFILICIMT